MKEILTASEKINHEYCASVVKVGEVIPIENSDFLAYTMINGKSIVVRKDEVSEGDIMFYADNETKLNEDFLGANNLYELSEFDKNSNASEVGALLTELKSFKNQFIKSPEDSLLKEKIEEIEGRLKTMVGFFNKQSRVRMIRLRKVPSMGFLFSKEAMMKWCPEVSELNLEDYVGKDFDTVNGELFIKVYVPYIPEVRERGHSPKNQKRVERFDRMIEGEFWFHYDTQPLNKNFYRLNPETPVVVSVKVHGTSAIFAHILTKKPKEYKTPFNWLTKLVNKLNLSLPIKWQKTEEVYDYIYSSRKVIKNQYINTKVTGGYYGEDVWGEYNELLKPYIPEGMTVYGEIFGYTTGSQKMIQDGYDYGCQEGTNKLMPYRITTSEQGGVKREWEVSEVKEWTENLIKSHPEIADRIFPIVILYEGTLGNLYPEVDPSNHWGENVLNLMSNESRWLMEKRESLCKKKVPREGIVLRIIKDPMKEAFKLKTTAFLEREAKEVDKGQVDVEMAENYGEEG